MGIPSVSTNLSGFGCFMEEHIADPSAYGQRLDRAKILEYWERGAWTLGPLRGGSGLLRPGGREASWCSQSPRENEGFSLFSETPVLARQVSTFWTGDSAAWMIPARSSPPSSTVSASRAEGSALSSGTERSASLTFWTGNT